MEYVIKRNGEKATFQISKIREVINWACKDIDINPLKLESSITSKFKNNIKTSDIQDILIQTCTSLASIDEPEWNSMEQEVYDMFKEAVKQEIEFSTHVIGDKILGMTCDSIEQYTKYLANKRLKAIGMNHIYEGIKNPYTHL